MQPVCLPASLPAPSYHPPSTPRTLPAPGAALADIPVVKSLVGGATTATLRFLKPTAASNQDTIAYRAQV